MERFIPSYFSFSSIRLWVAMSQKGHEWEYCLTVLWQCHLTFLGVAGICPRRPYVKMYPTKLFCIFTNVYFRLPDKWFWFILWAILFHKMEYTRLRFHGNELRGWIEGPILCKLAPVQPYIKGHYCRSPKSSDRLKHFKPWAAFV